MSRAVVFAIPGDLATASGGYAYARRVIDELGLLGWRVRTLALPAAYPHPEAQDQVAAEQAFAALPDDSLVLVDGLAFGAMPDIVRRHAPRLRLLALVHHPLGLETGLTVDRAHALLASERAALGLARCVITTSRATAAGLGDLLGVAMEKIVVAEPGTDPGPLAAGDGNPPRLIAVGSLTPRKGHDVLVDALAALAHRAWSCRIVGAAPDPETWRALHSRIAANGLQDRVEITGEVADVRAEMANADLFVLASRYEGYGMAYAEAMAQGLPVVGCRVGAVAALVPATAGVLVPPDDAPALAHALEQLLTNPARRRALAAGALEQARGLPTWRASAARIAAALEAA